MRFDRLYEHFASNSGQFALGQERAAYLIKLLDRSQKFYAGDVDRLPMSNCAAFPRLPFQTVGIEFTWPEDRGSCFAFVQDNADDEWGITYCIDALPHGYAYVGSARGRRGDSKFLVTPDLGGAENVPSRTADILFEAVEDSVYLVVRFLEVLNATNVTTQDITPSKALAKARLMRNKPPLYTYKILVLKRGGHRLASHPGDSHASPRVHLRRGHLKIRKSGTFWWQPHAVGNRKRGMVVKDYDARGIANE